MRTLIPCLLALAIVGGATAFAAALERGRCAGIEAVIRRALLEERAFAEAYSPVVNGSVPCGRLSL